MPAGCRRYASFRYNLARLPSRSLNQRGFLRRELIYAAPDDSPYLSASDSDCCPAIIEGATASPEKRPTRSGTNSPVFRSLLCDGCFQLRAGGGKDFADCDGTVTDGGEFAAADG